MNTAIAPFDNLVEQLFRTPFVQGSWSRDQYTRIVERDDAWDIQMAIPGSVKEDFDVSVENQCLHVTYNPKEGSFVSSQIQRMWHLPRDHDGEIKARFENGLLTIEVPHPAPARRISIN